MGKKGEKERILKLPFIAISYREKVNKFINLFSQKWSCHRPVLLYYFLRILDPGINYTTYKITFTSLLIHF